MLWLKTSGRAPSTVASACSSSPRKSGVSTSTEQSGSFAFSARIVAAKWPAPAVVDVVAVDRGDDDVLRAPICAAACASRSGSSGSGACSGLPELT